MTALTSDRPGFNSILIDSNFGASDGSQFIAYGWRQVSRLVVSGPTYISDIIDSADSELERNAAISAAKDSNPVLSDVLRVELTRRILNLGRTTNWDDRESETKAQLAIREALLFLSMFPKNVIAPSASIARDGVISFEWRRGEKKAISIFDGEGEYGYAYYVNGSFRPGEFVGSSGVSVPNDLTEYLAA